MPKTTSIIFVTLKDGLYHDRWSSDLHSLLTTHERAGFRELTWEGQRSGLRDKFVQRDTIIALRPNKSVLWFDLVGTVAEIVCTRKWTAESPAQYKILVDVAASPRRISKLPSDHLTHNNVLRELGFALETSAMPHGVYKK